VSTVAVVAVPAQPSTPQPPRLHSSRTEQCHVEWAVRFNRFHSMQHPNTMGAAEIEMFLTDLAVRMYAPGWHGWCCRRRYAAPTSAGIGPVKIAL
jgi:hypothetical protein